MMAFCLLFDFLVLLFFLKKHSLTDLKVQVFNVIIFIFNILRISVRVKCHQ